MENKPIIVIPNNPQLSRMAYVVPDVVYSTATGKPLKLTLLLPWGKEGETPEPRPLIVFVQGSAWTTPNINYQIPQLSRLAQQGYAVATVVHRDSTEGNAFPAYLQDVKCAIRFLRAHAKEYGIMTDRVAIFGTSSGGNTALLCGVTGDDERYRTDEWADQSDAVRCVIACFGPADMEAMLAGRIEEFKNNPLFQGLLGDWSPEELLRLMSPIKEIKPGRSYPPFLLAHGDKDDVVPFDQSEKMLKALQDHGVDAQLIRVIGAPHEGDFWSERLWGFFTEFLAEKL